LFAESKTKAEEFLDKYRKWVKLRELANG
jgi:hypothetical protein